MITSNLLPFPFIAIIYPFFFSYSVMSFGIHKHETIMITRFLKKGSDLGIIFSKLIYLINECLSAFLRVKVAIKLCNEHDTNVWFLSNFV